MCFGVRDAIDLALEQAGREPLTILGDLVHNETVLAGLRERGIRIVQKAAGIETGSVMITAHGASEKAIRDVSDRGHNVIQATCPLVQVAHRAVQALVREGFHPVIIGKREHVEVRGLTEDLEACDVILTEAEVFELRERPKFGVAAQTTQPVERLRHLTGLLRWRFPNSQVRCIDTVCQPTKQRQQAAVDLARQSDVVVVVGGSESNNTRELVKTCSRFCRQVFHVQTAGDLDRNWFGGARTVGITAGTSTPDAVIDQVENRLLEWATRTEGSTHPLPAPDVAALSI
jgi:4-hydroxy-3-methylbut-2-enyl diphosphate reductase